MYLMEFHGLSELRPLKCRVSLVSCAFSMGQCCSGAGNAVESRDTAPWSVWSLSLFLSILVPFWDEGSVRCNFLLYIRYVYLFWYNIIYNDKLHIHAYVCEVGVLPSFLSVFTCGRRLFCIPLFARCKARIFKEYDTNGNGTLEASEQLSSMDSIVNPLLAALNHIFMESLKVFVFWFLSFPLGSFGARMLVNYAWTLAACIRFLDQGWHLSWKTLSKALVLWPLEFQLL